MSNTQLYVQCASNGAITEPTGGSWMAAYALYLGATEPVYGSWLATVCVELGITEPLNGSWLIALANHYGITEPENGTWMYAIQNNACNVTPPTDLIWNTTTTNWEAEATLWNA